MKTLAILLVLLGTVPKTPGYQEAECDVIELNYYVRQNSELRQWIFWVRHPRGDLHVANWTYESAAVLGGVRFDHRTRWYEVTIYQERKILRIRAKTFKHTVTDYDPEFEDRGLVDTSSRRRLW
jgi:hypothetical protein